MNMIIQHLFYGMQAFNRLLYMEPPMSPSL